MFVCVYLCMQLSQIKLLASPVLTPRQAPNAYEIGR